MYFLEISFRIMAVFQLNIYIFIYICMYICTTCSVCITLSFDSIYNMFTVHQILIKISKVFTHLNMKGLKER